MKRRAESVDVFRALALLIVLLYHSWVLTGSHSFQYDAVNLIISLGGEIGVTAFFLLSGYGIYHSIAAQEAKEGFRFKKFMTRRCRRIMPHYYFSIFIAVVFFYGGSFVSKGGIKSIVTHFLFVHNFFADCHGTINGALWTMAITVQFYLIAYWLYKGMKKWGIFFQVFTIILTIAAKAFVYVYVLPAIGDTGHSLGFLSGRQLLTALDNFTTGMYVAYIIDKKDFKVKQGVAVLGAIAGCILIYIICLFGRKYGIHTNNLSGYTWHSLLSIGLGIVLFSVSFIPCKRRFKITKGLLWISKYEYGIYIWHMLIINNLIQSSQVVGVLRNAGYPQLVYLLFIVLSVIVGFLFSRMVDLYSNEVEQHYLNRRNK